VLSSAAALLAAFLSSLRFGISYALIHFSECDAAFSLPPERTSVEFTIMLPCSLNTSKVHDEEQA
jgi:hypothetical protein